MNDEPRFEDDLAMMNAHGAGIVTLVSDGGGRIAVSPSWQGRVMTSATSAAGASLGFLHRAFIEARKTGTAFDNYGGEDRFWLGPEAGQYGLYFAPNAPFVIAHWQTPHELQEGAWAIASIEKNGGTPHAVRMVRRMRVHNRAGTEFELEVTRTVRALDRSDLAPEMGVSLAADLHWVGFVSENAITNVGKQAWTKESGLLSIWILGMYNPSDDTRVIVPFDRQGKGPIVNDAYFGKIPADRLRVDEEKGLVTFVADAHHRSKLGIGPARARDALGSYSPRRKLFTLVKYSHAPAATDYVNSSWEEQTAPYAGDVVNSYNDGPTEPGKAALGGFYELETSSPALALRPGETATHVHRTLHVMGDEASLEPNVRATLGVSLRDVR